MWQVKSFDELTTYELWSIYRARMAVFVEEQHILHQDVDDLDLTAFHVFYQEGSDVLAYARVFAKDDQTLTFGRVLTVSAIRGQGFGQQLITKVMTVLAEKFKQTKIEIEAQEHAVALYQRFGFQTVGPTFMEVGVPHRLMVGQNHREQ